MTSFKALLLAFLFTSLLAGCIYKMDIQQGNQVTQHQVDKLKHGMSREEVMNIMGTPLIQDPFHKNRWDYIYQLQQKGDLVEQYRVTLHFTDNKLTRIQEGDIIGDGPKP